MQYHAQFHLSTGSFTTAVLCETTIKRLKQWLSGEQTTLSLATSGGFLILQPGSISAVTVNTVPPLWESQTEELSAPDNPDAPEPFPALNPFGSDLDSTYPRRLKQAEEGVQPNHDSAAYANRVQAILAWSNQAIEHCCSEFALTRSEAIAIAATEIVAFLQSFRTGEDP